MGPSPLRDQPHQRQQLRLLDRVRALTIVDVFKRECLVIQPGQELGVADLVAVLSRVADEPGAPQMGLFD